MNEFKLIKSYAIDHFAVELAQSNDGQFRVLYKLDERIVAFPLMDDLNNALFMFDRVISKVFKAH